MDGEISSKSGDMNREFLLTELRLLADYQFGKGCGEILFPDTVKFVFSTTGRVRQIIDNGVRIATLKAGEGVYTVSIEGARRLHSFLKFPALRVVVMDEVTPFIKKGGNVFAKHVVDMDDKIRANDEVLVVDEQDDLLATGKAMIGAIEMKEFTRGMAVNVRWGIEK
jgi:uncharacterized protein with predicted RNA binding PUA domain